jgi:hypothetical protein
MLQQSDQNASEMNGNETHCWTLSPATGQEISVRRQSSPPTIEPFLDASPGVRNRVTQVAIARFSHLRSSHFICVHLRFPDRRRPSILALPSAGGTNGAKLSRTTAQEKQMNTVQREPQPGNLRKLCEFRGKPPRIIAEPRISCRRYPERLSL